MQHAIPITFRCAMLVRAKKPFLTKIYVVGAETPTIDAFLRNHDQIRELLINRYAHKGKAVVVLWEHITPEKKARIHYAVTVFQGDTQRTFQGQIHSSIEETLGQPIDFDQGHIARIIFNQESDLFSYGSLPMADPGWEFYFFADTATAARLGEEYSPPQITFA